MYKSAELFDAAGATVGRIDQGIMAISIKPLGAVVNGRQRITFDVAVDEDERSAYVDAFVDAAVVKPEPKSVDRDTSGAYAIVSDREPKAAEGTVAPGTCLYASASRAKPIGVTRQRFVAVPDSPSAVVEVDGLLLWAGRSRKRACTPKDAGGE